MALIEGSFFSLLSSAHCMFGPQLFIQVPVKVHVIQITQAQPSLIHKYASASVWSPLPLPLIVPVKIPIPFFMTDFKGPLYSRGKSLLSLSQICKMRLRTCSTPHKDPQTVTEPEFERRAKGEEMVVQRPKLSPCTRCWETGPPSLSQA